jgi:uncharacterized membrane protein
MKRLIAPALGAILALGLMAGPAQASQVFCRIPSAHRVTCFNYTGHQIFIRIVVRTSQGPKVHKGWWSTQKWTWYFQPVVYHVSWMWHY